MHHNLVYLIVLYFVFCTLNLSLSMDLTAEHSVIGKSEKSVSSKVALATSASAEDNAILSLLMSSSLSHDKRPLVVLRQTMESKHLQDTIKSYRNKSKGGSALTEAAIKDFLHRNDRVATIPAVLSERPLQYISQKEAEKLLQAHSWSGFYKKYPGSAGLVQLTLPGYSMDKKFAVVYYQWASGGRSGAGVLYLLTKEAGQWKINRAIGGWRS